jgi:hypothetical protein
MSVYPNEYDNLDVNFIDLLKKRRYTTRVKVEKYLNTDQGQRTFVEYERTIRLVFKGGKIGWIKPSQGLNIRMENPLHQIH